MSTIDRTDPKALVERAHKHLEEARSLLDKDPNALVNPESQLSSTNRSHTIAKLRWVLDDVESAEKLLRKQKEEQRAAGA